MVDRFTYRIVHFILDIVMVRLTVIAAVVVASLVTSLPSFDKNKDESHFDYRALLKNQWRCLPFGTFLDFYIFFIFSKTIYFQKQNY